MILRKLLGFHDARANQIEKMRIAKVVSAINRAGDHVGGLEIVSGP